MYIDMHILQTFYYNMQHGKVSGPLSAIFGENNEHVS